MSDAIPFTIARNQKTYSFFYGHESNEVIEQMDGLCRGFLLSLKSQWKGTEILQLDPATNRYLYDSDTSLGKHHFYTMLLNLLLSGYPSPLLGKITRNQNGGELINAYFAVTNEQFRVESIISIDHKPYLHNLMAPPGASVTTTSMPWIVEFETL